MAFRIMPRFFEWLLVSTFFEYLKTFCHRGWLAPFNQKIFAFK